MPRIVALLWFSITDIIKANFVNDTFFDVYCIIICVWKLTCCMLKFVNFASLTIYATQGVPLLLSCVLWFVVSACIHIVSGTLFHYSVQWENIIELDWIEEYQWVNLPRLWEAVSGEDWIQKWSHFQLDLLFSPRPCTKSMGKKTRWQPPIFVCCLLIGPNSFTPLFRSSSMEIIITCSSLWSYYPIGSWITRHKN